MNIQPEEFKSTPVIQGDYRKAMVWGSAIFCLIFSAFAAAAYFGIETFGQSFVTFLLSIAPLPLRWDPNFRRPIDGSGEWATFWAVLAFVSLDALLYFRLKNRDSWFIRFFYPDKVLKDPKAFASMIFGHIFIIMMAFCLLAGAVSYLFMPNKGMQPTSPTHGPRDQRG